MPACASPATASPGHDGDRDRQEQRQHDGQRGDGEQRRRWRGPPTGRPAPVPAAGQIGSTPAARDQGRQEVEQADRDPGAAAGGTACAARPAITGRPPRSASGRGARPATTCSSVGRSGPSSRTATPAATSRAFTRAGSAAADDEPFALDHLDRRPVEDLVREGDVRRVRRRSARWAPAAWPGTPGARAGPGRGRPTRVQSCSTSASRWLDRKIVVPASVQVLAAGRGSRGCPAGRGRWSARRARAARAGAAARPARPSR